MTKTITFNDLRRLKDSLPEGATHRIADNLHITVQTVRNYFGGSNYEFGKNCGVHIEPGPGGGIVVLDDTTIYDMAVQILEEEEKRKKHNTNDIVPRLLFRLNHIVVIKGAIFNYVIAAIPKGI